MVVLPPLTYGVSMHHRSFPWTISINPDTLTALIVDIAESLLCHDIRKLLIVTAHDGNPAPAQNACRVLHDRHGLHAALLSGWQGRARELLAGQFDIDLDHAGSSEMSLVLHAAPHLARPDGAAALPNEPVGLPVAIFGAFADLAPHGYTGNPARGTAAEGQAIVDAIANQVVPFLRQLDANGWQPGPWMYEYAARLQQQFAILPEREATHRKEPERPFITTAQRIRYEDGLVEGLLQSIEVGLELKLGEPGLALLPEIREISNSQQLQALLEGLKTAQTPDDVRAIYRTQRRKRAAARQTTPNE
jgi:creatinine amidohydrolase